MTESQLQRAVARLLDHSGMLWLHVPNGGHRHPAVAAKLKAEGVKAGAPDVLVFDSVHIRSQGVIWEYNGLAIELKVGRNKPSAAQREWHEKLRARGWRVEVCRTIDEVLEVLRECYPNIFKA